MYSSLHRHQCLAQQLTWIICHSDIFLRIFKDSGSIKMLGGSSVLICLFMVQIIPYIVGGQNGNDKSPPSNTILWTFPWIFAWVYPKISACCSLRNLGQSRPYKLKYPEILMLDIQLLTGLKAKGASKEERETLMLLEKLVNLSGI